MEELVTQLNTLISGLQTALDNANAALASASNPQPSPGDPAWDAVKAALVANGWVAPVVQIPVTTPEETPPADASTDTPAEG